MKLGMQTDTLDLEGEVLKEDLNWNKLKTEEIIEVLNRFKGSQKQIPPMYSAVHHQGKRLYKLARKGISVEREAREINVFSLKIIKIELPIIRLKLKVSRGTYIRSLVRDIGEELGSAAVLSFLLRTQSGPFKIEDALTVEEVEKKGTEILLETHQPLDLPKYTVKDSSLFRAENGNYLLDKDFVEEEINLEIEDYFMSFSEDNKFLSINQYIKKDDYLIYQPVKVFI
jgi:tRNA pseudouridine55 synthase